MGSGCGGKSQGIEKLDEPGKSRLSSGNEAGGSSELDSRMDDQGEPQSGGGTHD